MLTENKRKEESKIMWMLKSKTEVIWVCYNCRKHNKSFFPSKNDVYSRFSLKTADTPLQYIAHSIPAVGVRKCKKCGLLKAIVVYDAHPYIEAFSYNLTSETGIYVLKLMKENNKTIPKEDK